MTDRQASSLEIRPLRTAAERYDVAILGGGLAGLTLAIQLKRRRPETSVAVLEKREGPAPLAAFKVGESTVPSGAHYFASVVGMEDHLKEVHLASAGCASSSGRRQQGHHQAGGARGPLPAARQLPDRPGRFENELASRARGRGRRAPRVPGAR